MKKLYLSLLLSCVTILLSSAQMSQYDLNYPFGWATSKYMTTGDDYDLTGGGDGESYTLVSNGGDMRSSIANAIKNYDVIILDGSEGDFIISSTIDLKGLENKTIVGVNNARLCTQFYVTPEIAARLDEVGVKGMSSSGGGGTLSNGTSVSEEREYYTRQTLIDMLNDSGESYRNAGLFYISGCSNIIIRNLQFVGPGPIDVGGDDLISVINSTSHIWIDHCDFTDGIDGNLDITVKSDFVTISWCTFSYTSRAYDHMNSNLIGGSDTASAQGENNLNVTWANNVWGSGCKQRMPMARFGTIHLMNNYYNCPGNQAGINARKNSELLIENNYFEEGVENIFSESSSKAYMWSGNIFCEDFTPSNKGSVSVPYQYTLYAAIEVPDELTNTTTGAGATLDDPLDISERVIVETETKVWDFTTWSTTSRNYLANNPDIWTAMDDGRYENTFDTYTDLCLDETAGITFVDDVRINPSTSGGGYVQGALSMMIPVEEGQKFVFSFSHTSNSKGTRQLLVNGEEIGETSSTSATTAGYTVPADVSTLTVCGSGGLRYYTISCTWNACSDSRNITTADYALVRMGNTITTDSDHRIEVYNLQGVCVAMGYYSVAINELHQGIYIVRCGNKTMKIVK